FRSANRLSPRNIVSIIESAASVPWTHKRSWLVFVQKEADQLIRRVICFEREGIAQPRAARLRIGLFLHQPGIAQRFQVMNQWFRRTAVEQNLIGHHSTSFGQ